MPAYYQAKLAADETLTVLGEERIRTGSGKFQYISLRPGQLTDEEETGKVTLGKTKARGSVTRDDVAEVAVRLLGSEKACGWYDLLGGEEDIKREVERVVEKGVNSMDGESLGTMKVNME